ncbi:MAG: PEP-CTERM sorting domain-containing protein [Sphaerospermopsis sp. SIO1G1]|nr:PEP-CTERM sorting domain-containing protein [Sphaerospermopsis sp. SIO1G1]
MSNLKNLCQSLSKKALQSVGVGVATTAMALGAGVVVESASAATIGGITLSDDGFANAAFTFDENFNPGGNFIGTNGVVAGSLTDTSINTFAFSSDGTGFALLEFSDVLNAAGDDIALFSLQDPNAVFRVSADFGATWADFGVRGLGTTTTISPIVDVFAAEIDLTSLGVAQGDFINSLVIDFNTTNSPALALAGTIQTSVPEPSAMFGLLATIGFLVSRRGLKRAKAA